MDADTFRCEVAKASDDQYGNKVTSVKCYGRLVAGTAADEIKGVVKLLLANGGRIVVDLGGVDYLDSSGLGALVGLKVSALNQGFCTLEFVEMTPRVMELLRISNLAQMLTAKAS